VSGIAFGPDFASAALASALVSPRDTLLPPLSGADEAKTAELEAAGIVSQAFGSRDSRSKHHFIHSKKTELSIWEHSVIAVGSSR
jgi:hypothetical protein